MSPSRRELEQARQIKRGDWGVREVPSNQHDEATLDFL